MAPRALTAGAMTVKICDLLNFLNHGSGTRCQEDEHGGKRFGDDHRQKMSNKNRGQTALTPQEETAQNQPKNQAENEAKHIKSPAV